MLMTSAHKEQVDRFIKMVLIGHKADVFTEEQAQKFLSNFTEAIVNIYAGQIPNKVKEDK